MELWLLWSNLERDVLLTYYDVSIHLCVMNDSLYNHIQFYINICKSDRFITIFVLVNID